MGCTSRLGAGARLILLAPGLLTAAAVSAPVATCLAEQPFSFDATPGQLPKDVVPLSYIIDVATDLDRLTITGAEEIMIDVRRPVSSITLNQAGLKLSAAVLEDGTQARITADETAQTATLRFPSKVAPGRQKLHITWTGPIPATPNGLYYDDYKTKAGQNRRMLVSQFEVADARRMFPGWDEPAFKATFQLSVTLKSDLQVVSNMPIASQSSAAPGLKHVVFAQTPRMSTYLLALVAGDMAALHATAAGTDMALWAPTGTQSQGGYALHAESEILPYYNEYFGVPYPLPKLDLIAIPGNYAAGAMENWGAITFVDNALLFDPKTSSPHTREVVFLDVAHEMAHQWSGDLVTMGWWDNIWLNEGFATWMEIKATDHFNPDWEVWPRQHGAREDAMAQDAQPTTHAIQQVIHDVSEADSAFDQISYQKGEQVIRMVEDWIGPDVFRDGMRRYMKAHQYGNATSADLWVSLGQAAGHDVATVARSFTEQPGIPLVEVSRRCEAGVGHISLTQSRFTIHDPNAAKLVWQIPVSYGPPGGPAKRVLLGGTPVTLPIGGCDAAEKFNLGETGYYRTQYDASSLKALTTAFTTLAPVDRADLLGDQFALFRGGRAPLADYLDLLPTLSGEQDVAVWEDTLDHLEMLDNLAAGSPEQSPFRAFARGLLAPELARLGWDAEAGEGFLASLLRPEVIDAMGVFEDPAVIAEARRRFAAADQDAARLPPALQAPVLRIVGRSADRATWDRLRAAGERASSTEDKLRYFNAMALAADPGLIQANVAFANSGAIPNGRIVGFLYRMAEGASDPDAVWRAILAAKGSFTDRLAPAAQDSLLPAAAMGSSSPAVADALLAQPSSTATTGGRIQAAKVADAIRSRVELRARAVPALKGWLSAHA